MENPDSRFRRVKVPPRGAMLRCLKNEVSARQFVVIGTELFGYNSHWTKEGCRFYFDNREECICKDRDLPIREKFFLQVMCGTTGGEWMLELTAEGSRMFEETAKQLETVRGQVIRVYRRGKTTKTPMLVDFLGRYTGEFELPLAKDLLPSVKRLWRIE